MNVTSDDLRAYIEVFHQSLAATSMQYLPPGQERSLLRHAALLPAKIRAHVSSTFGIAVEYEPAKQYAVVVNEGKERIEDLLLGSPAWAREVAPMFTFEGPAHTLRKRPLARGFPFRLASERASVTLEDVIVQLGPWKRVVHYAEVYGSRNADDWTLEKAHARAHTEVLLGLIHLKNAGERELAIDDYLEQYRDKVVMLLGGPGPGDEARLDAIAGALRSFHYEPVRLGDIPSEPAHDLWETLRAVGANARFAMIDASPDAGRQLVLCRDQGWLTAPLAAQGTSSEWLPADAPGDSVLATVTYEPAETSSAVLQALRRLEARREEVEGRMRG